MNKWIRSLVFSFIISWLFQAGLIAQENDTTKAEIIIHKMRLPFPASKDKKAEYYSLDDEVAITIIEAKQELGLYDLIVGIYVDSTETVQDSMPAKFNVINFDEIVSTNQAVVIIATDIFQKGVPPEDDEAYFSLDRDISKEKTNDYPKNIQTRLAVYAQIFDTNTGASLGNFDLEVFHTGGSVQKSKARALQLLKEKAKEELKRSYWFSAGVIETRKGMPGIPFGTKSRVGKGMIFELVEPDRMWELDGEEFLVPGGSAAIATVVDTAADSSGFKILRQWRDTYPGCYAVEQPTPIFSLGINFSPPSPGSYSNLGFCFQFGPLWRFDWGVGMQIIKVTDSDDEDDYGFGFSGFGIWRVVNTSKIDFGGKLGMDLDIPFKKDDDGQAVHTLLFSSYLGLVGEFLISKKIDFSITTGYRFGLRNDDWQYTEDEEDFPAYWEQDAPEVKNSGLMVAAGFKFLLF